MKLSIPMSFDLPIPFAELFANPSRIVECMPRVERIDQLQEGRVRITMQTTQFTPLVKYQPVGIVDIRREGNTLRWVPCECPQSKGTLEGTATATTDGATHIEAKINIDDPALPQLWTPLLNVYLQRVVDKLIAEFKEKWVAAHPA
jgi:hypothetical protein